MYFFNIVLNMSFSCIYLRLNTEEKIEMTQQQVSKLVDEPYAQVSTTELEISEELKAVCKIMLAFQCTCMF